MEQQINSIELHPTSNHEITTLDSPTLLQEYGGSASAIILAVAVLLRAVAEIIKVLVPVMLNHTERR